MIGRHVDLSHVEKWQRQVGPVDLQKVSRERENMSWQCNPPCLQDPPSSESVCARHVSLHATRMTDMRGDHGNQNTLFFWECHGSLEIVGLRHLYPQILFASVMGPTKFYVNIASQFQFQFFYLLVWNLGWLILCVHLGLLELMWKSEAS